MSCLSQIRSIFRFYYILVQLTLNLLAHFRRTLKIVNTWDFVDFLLLDFSVGLQLNRQYRQSYLKIKTAENKSQDLIINPSRGRILLAMLMF